MRSSSNAVVILLLALSMPTRASATPPAQAFWGLENHGDTQVVRQDDVSSLDFAGRPGQDIGLTRATAEREANAAVIVAILDTGIDAAHPALAGRIHPGGRDFTGRDPGDGSDTRDAIGHGTHVAGIISSLFSRSGNLRILPIKVVSSAPLAPVRPQQLRDSGGGGFVDRVAQAIDYATASGARVINLSMSWPAAAGTPSMRAALADAVAKGVLIVAAAGNDSVEARSEPCAHSGVVCVGAHGPSGEPAYFTNYGGAVKLHAPGLHILSTWPTSLRAMSYTEESGYDYDDGSSMAAPFVTGILARLLADGATAPEALSKLYRGARPAPSPSGTPDPRASAYGNADLALAQRARPSSWIEPSSGEAIRVPVAAAAREVVVELSLTNVGIGLVDGTIRIATDDARVTAREWRFDQWAPGAAKTLKVILRVPEDLSGLETRDRIRLRITDAEGATRAIDVPVRISALVEAGSERSGSRVLRLPRALSPGESLRSVTSADGRSEQDYLVVEARGGSRGRLRILVEAGGEYRESPELETAAPEGIPLMQVFRVAGPRGDGSHYVLLFSAPDGQRASPCEFRVFDSRGAKVAAYAYRNDLAPVAQSLRFISVAGEASLMPAWVGPGKRPISERGQRSGHRGGADVEGIENRLYYLGGDGSLHTIAAPAGLRYIDVLEQSDGQRLSGTVGVVMAKGAAPDQSYVVAEAREARLSDIRPFAMGEYQTLAPGVFIPVTGFYGSSGARPSAYALPSAAGTAKARITDSERVVKIAPSRPIDAVIRVSAAFASEGARGAFSETYFDLQYHDLDAGTSCSTSLNRTSYLSGDIFSRTYFPVVAESAGERLAAMFQPGGFVDSGAMEVVVAGPRAADGARALRRPARLALEAGAGCRSIGNPVPASRLRPSMMAFLCGDRIVQVPLAY